MFDRSHESRVPVVISMVGGETMSGSIRLPLSNKLVDAINGKEPFIDFCSIDGAQYFLAKHSVRSVEAIQAPQANQLNRPERIDAAFDPYQILGLPKGASEASIKQAYHQLARSYHPDRFASIDLPREMSDYATAMLARINLAYQQLRGPADRTTASTTH